MATETISFTLDSRSVGYAIRKIEKYTEHFKECMKELISRLAEEGAMVAKIEIVSMGALDTLELFNSVYGYIYGYYSSETHVGLVGASAPHAIFVEYGTGIVGANSDHHPGGEGWDIGWEHDVNGHGDNGWVYISDRDGKLHWTKGMAARPFLYETQKYLESICRDVYNEVFSK